ncbi:MAG: hypothetical protein WBE79_14075 [Candidatus Cybelea sp.]
MRGTSLTTLLGGALVASLSGCGGSQSQNAAVPVTALATNQHIAHHGMPEYRTISTF